METPAISLATSLPFKVTSFISTKWKGREISLMAAGVVIAFALFIALLYYFSKAGSASARVRKVPKKKKPAPATPSNIPPNPSIPRPATKLLDCQTRIQSSNQPLNFKMEVSQDQNTLFRCFIEDNSRQESKMNTYAKSIICRAGLVYFLESAPDLAKATIHIRSLEESIAYFFLGVAPGGMQDAALQNIKGIEGIRPSPENYLKMQQLKYPQKGVWISKGCQAFWENHQQNRSDLASIYKQLSALSHYTLVKQSLSKPERKFPISSGSHKALMIIGVSQKENALLVLTLKDLVMDSKSVIDSSLQPKEQFRLYQTAIMKLWQYADRFPLPKDDTGSEQPWAPAIFSEVNIKASSRKLIDMLWRLGFAPEDKTNNIADAYSNTIKKMNPLRYQLQNEYKKVINDRKNPDKSRQMVSNLLQKMDPEMLQEWQSLSQEPPSEQVEIRLNQLIDIIIAECTPNKLDDKFIVELNTQVNTLLDSRSAKLPVTLTSHIEFMPWQMSKLEDEVLNGSTLKEFEMFERSYELHLDAAPQIKSEK